VLSSKMYYVLVNVILIQLYKFTFYKKKNKNCNTIIGIILRNILLRTKDQKYNVNQFDEEGISHVTP